VALLPDASFFTRALPVTSGATSAEAATQIELGLEAASPFPLAQLYYGWFWRPGAEHALVFAAYRRRFTTEQVAAWEGAELVLPAFGAVLGAPVEPATTVVLASDESLTAVHWTTADAPSSVITVPVAREATDEQRARARDQLLRTVGGSKTVINLESPLVADPARSDRERVFRSGDFISRLPAGATAALDVRDKAELTAMRNARKRDILMWRVAVACVLGLLLLVLGEVGLFGARQWHSVRVREVNAQKPLVDKISGLHELANRIDELATRRLLPIEMVTVIVGVDNDRLPADITFTRIVADQERLYTLLVEGQTMNPAQINVYEAALRALPEVESANAVIAQLQGDRARFNLTVVFKPEGLRPIQPLRAASQ
jgi:hypothetical protein